MAFLVFFLIFLRERNFHSASNLVGGTDKKVLFEKNVQLVLAVSSIFETVALAYGDSNMKPLGVFLLPSGRDASSPPGYPQH